MEEAKSYEAIKNMDTLPKIEDMPKGEVVNHVKDLLFYEIMLKDSDGYHQLEVEERTAINERAMVRANYFLDLLR